MVDLGARARGEVTRIAVVMDVRSRAFTADLGAVHQGPGRPRLPAAAAVPGGVRRGAGAPVRAGAAQPPAAGRRPAGRRHRRRARAAAPAAGERRPGGGHLRAWRCPSCGPPWSARSAASPAQRTHVTVVSFGYKYGLPMDSDLVVDVRFLPNPFWIPELRDQTGRDEPVRDYVLARTAPRSSSTATWSCCGLVGAGYRREGKRYLTVSVGCTGGKHRSVAISEEIARRLSGRTAREGIAGQRRAPGPGARVSGRGGRRWPTAGGGARRRARAARHPVRAAPAGRPRHALDHVTAVVTVADDGGSSGRLRRELGSAAAGRPADGDGRAGRRRRRRQPLAGAACSTASAAPARWPGTPWATCCWPA